MAETDKLEDMEFLADIMMAREEVENAETPEEAESIAEETRGKVSRAVTGRILG